MSLRWIQDSLIISGICMLGLWTTALIETRAFQSAGEHRLDSVFEHGLTIGARPLPAPRPSSKERRSDRSGARAVATRAEARSSGWIGRIEIPRLGVSAAVADGADATTLRRAVGHVPWTAFPGEQGNVGLAGHRDSFFRKLEGVRKNDLIRVSTPDGVYGYRVESTTVVDKRRVDVLAPSPDRQLTLVTCFPFHYVGAAPKRFIVRARQIEPDGGADRELASDRPGQTARTEASDKGGYSLR